MRGSKPKEIVGHVPFQKVKRSYHVSSNGWRLATFKEATDGLNVIKEQNILNKWDRVRLLDGWITGAGYNFDMGNDFKGCLGYMLLIQTKTYGFAYADVDLSDSGKEVALFLCVDDWNFEVVYWLLNSWSGSETMNLADVRGGNLPVVDTNTFKRLNENIGHVARRLGDVGGAARERAINVKYTGMNSVKEVLSGMLKCVTDEKEIVQFIRDQNISHLTFFEADEYCFPEDSSVKCEEVEDALWSFVCDSFVGYVVEVCALECLRVISKNTKKKSTGGIDFMVAARILLNLSDYRSDIIHEPMAHHCSNLCAAKILSYTSKEAAANPQDFNMMLQKNGMWRCYDGTGSYSLLHKLLIIVAKTRYNDTDKGERVAGDVVKLLLKCGADPLRRYAIGKSKRKTTLQLVARFRDENVGEEVANALLDRCAEESIHNFVNAADDRRRTALHRASQKGNARICKLLLNRGASLTAQDEYEMTALHYALEGVEDKVKDLLLKSPLVTESLGLKDYRDRRAVDIAVTKEDYASTAKLLSKMEDPEAYLSKVDKKQLLRSSILVGSVSIVSHLFEEGIKLPNGDCDDDGRTAFHLAAMCDDESSAIEIIFLKTYVETIENVEKMVVIQDRRGRTALHEAAFKGQKRICLDLLSMNSELIYVKDRYGQNPIYDAVRGEFKGKILIKRLLAAYLKKDKPEDDLVDRTGLTPLHLAASEGKASYVKVLLSSDRIKKRYLSRGDMVGRTALHKAAKRGDNDIVEILLKKGAHPLRERDCDGRTALHYAVQADNGDRIKLVETLLQRCTEEENSLLLWASAAGLGTADEKLSITDPLHKFLVDKKKIVKLNLLKTAASLKDIQMTKELLSRGYPIEDIRDPQRMTDLTEEEKNNMKMVSTQIEMIKEQGNDKPAIADSLGRLDYAHGLAALFLNPYIKPPIAVGITGSWGMGKSSLMLQTERILLTTAAHMALLQSSRLSSSASNLPDIKPCKLSKAGKKKWGHIYKHIEYGVNRNTFVILWHNLKRKPNRPSIDQVQKKLEHFLNNDELKNIEVFKALAAMDSSNMLEKNMSRSKEDPSAEQNVPAVLTVQYNAWKYKNDTEALAGLSVEITKELEGIMTPAQWLNTCWRYNWEKKKYTILIEIFIPCFLAMVLASSIVWIAWIVLGTEKFKKWGDAKYAWPPAVAATILWTLTRKVMGVLKPISSQLMQYMSAPDHTDKLGYQERVISDIKFLKAETGKKPHSVFIVIAWICSAFSVLLRHRSVGKAMETLKISPASGNHLRIIVFVDDLDRCDEFVILQVLSAVNLVLAVCEISVVLGMDKRLIESAILKRHGDQNAGISLIDNQKLAEMYLQKIIQLPLDLPDPSDEETKRFLRAQLGVLQQNRDEESMKDDTISSGDEGKGEAIQQDTETQFEITVQPDLGMIEMERRERAETGEVRSQTDGDASVQQNPSPLVVQNPFILQREILFVTYSEGEEKAFLFFQSLATDCRKLPREWKRLLNYHRLVWYIFSVSKEANKLTGWQVQFITWIFVCWEWQENMDFVIKKWKEIVNTPESNGFSLLMIVEHLIEEHQREMQATSKAEVSSKKTQKTSECEGSVVETNKDEETISSSTDVEEQNEKKAATSKKLVKKKNVISLKLDAVVNSLANLEEEMQKLKEHSCEMKKKIKELQEEVSGEMKKDIAELKRHMVTQQNGENEENMEPQQLNLRNFENWKRMKKALERCDVPMDAIQAFQRFRFYCIAGYLPLSS